MSSNHLILYCPLLLPSIFLSIRVFSNESVLRIRWPKYWSFCFSISPSNEYSGLISFRMDCLISLQSKGVSRVFSNTTVQKHQFFGTQVNLTVSPVLSLSCTMCVHSALEQTLIPTRFLAVSHAFICIPLSMIDNICAQKSKINN